MGDKAIHRSTVNVMSYSVLSEDFASDAAIVMTMHTAKLHSSRRMNFEVRVMVSQRRGRGIFVVSNPMPHKLRQERHLALRWSFEMDSVQNYKDAAPTALPKKLQWFLMQPRVRGGDEAFEKRMRLVRLAQKLRVKLAGDEKGMILEFNDFNQLAVGRQAAENKTGLFKFLAVGVVEFVAVAVAFVDHE
jgi:hypothetical protein